MTPTARAVAGLAVSAAALVAGGCGAGGAPRAAGGAGGGAVALHDRAVVLITRGGDPAFARGARTEASRLGDRLRLRGHPGLTAGEQILIVDAVIAAKPGAVIIAPVDRAALAAPIASLTHAGIAVVSLPAGRAGGTPRADAAAGAAAVRRAAGSLRAPTR